MYIVPHSLVLLSAWFCAGCIWSTCFHQPWKGKFQTPRVTPRHWTIVRARQTDVPVPREDRRYRIYLSCVLPDASRERISKPFYDTQRKVKSDSGESNLVVRGLPLWRMTFTTFEAQIQTQEKNKESEEKGEILTSSFELTLRFPEHEDKQTATSKSSECYRTFPVLLMVK